MLALVILMTLTPPVGGPVLRAFAGGDDPFARGLRRAVVLSARAGEAVRAPCSGVVAFAGATPRGPALTVRCGRRRVTVMPVRAAVAPGAGVGRGAAIGVAQGDVGMSVRDPDGSYVAPRFARSVGPPPMSPAPRPPAPRHAPPEPAPPRVPPMPWPAWAGVALLLCAGVRLRVGVRSARLVRHTRLKAERGSSP